MTAVNVFVAPGGNGFMSDIADWIVEAAALTKRLARRVDDRLPQRDGSINLAVAPHELYYLSDATDAEIVEAAACSVPVCTEQPGTPWYHLSLGFCRPSPLALDINRHGVDALRRDGVDALHLQLGGVPSMDRRGAERDIDVLFLGGDTEHRAAKLASLGPMLWRHHAELRLFRFTRPVRDGVPGLVFGPEKYALLARSRILLNVHRDDTLPGYFEWARMVEAMANGCTVVTEASTGYAPLQPGVHFVETSDLAAEIEALLADPERLAQIGAAAARAVLDEHPLVESLAPLLTRIEATELPAAPRRRRAPKLIREHRPPLFGPFRPADALRHRTYGAFLAEQRLQREIEEARCVLRHGVPGFVVEHRSAAYDAATPQISVIVTVFNYAHLVTETLDSLAASTGVEVELIVVDDHSTDAGRSVVRAWSDGHPDIALLLLGSENNRGLPEARNLGWRRARADNVFVIDADNLVYPPCLRRLADALDADPGAAFAYTTMEAFGAEPALRSALDWYVPWLCDANYIDAQAMLRKDTLERHGGYRHDDEMYGWEDWDLWLRLAVAGERGVHIPEMLGRYRTQPRSMVGITNLAAEEMIAHLRALYPALPWQ